MLEAKACTPDPYSAAAIGMISSQKKKKSTEEPEDET